MPIVDKAIKLCEESFTTLNSPGICLACGEDQDGCEPDARNYECESCGANKVFGAEEVVMMLAWSIEKTTIQTMNKKQLIDWLGDLPDKTPIVAAMADDVDQNAVSVKSESAMAIDVMFDHKREAIVLVVGV